MKKIIISACILSLITIACDRENSSSTLLEENINKNNIKNASLKEQLIYKKFYLQQVPKIIQKLGITSEELLALARNSEKNGQQTNTFILQDVIAYAKSKNKTIDNALSQKIEDVQKAFYGLDDTNYNISIYVPFLNEQSNKSSTEDIYIFDDTEDSEQEYFEGYVLNEDGNYVTYNQMINENLAEDLTASGKNVIIMGTQSITTVTNPPPSNGNNKTFRVGTTIIKDGKESWVGGDSEITIQFYKYEKSVLNKINIINTNYNSHSEYLFATFSRKQVKNQTPKILNFPLTTTVDVTPSVFANSKFCYVIYERDGWPTTERKTPFTIPNQNPFKYGSYNLDYYNSNHHNLIVPSVVDNASIKFSPYFN